MIVALQVFGYIVLVLLLAFGGNPVCKWVLRASRTSTPPESGPTISLRAGRVIGVLERVLIFVGLAVGSWEILAGVIALKTVARYKELDDQIKAEYFLIGSLTSILWAVLLTAAITLYDRSAGLHVLTEFVGLFDNEPPAAP